MTVQKDYLRNCRSIAVMGGTFDPIHFGHLSAAEAVLHRYKPQRLLFIPSGQPPHKNRSGVTAAEHRFQMALLAVAGHPNLDVSPIELEREGPSYTVDTIAALRERCPSDAAVYFITGADGIGELLTWKDAERLLGLCRFIALTRPGYDKECLHSQIKFLRERYKGQIDCLEIPQLAISGSDIRMRFAAGQPLRFLLPRDVEDYARRHELYTDKPSYEAIKQTLSERMSEGRFTHTIGVIEEAEKLAARYGADPEKARLAGLLHDCAKEFSGDKKRTLCRLWGIPLDPIVNGQIDLSHSLLGAESVQREFYIDDEDIARAIRYHTTGNKNMALLDKVIMLADFTEPYREDYPGLAEMRRHAYTDINKALRIGIRETIKANRELGRLIHPWSKKALKELEDPDGKK